MKSPRPHRRQMVLGSGAAVLLVAVAATGAQAATSAAPHLSTAVVRAALPSSYGMPAGVKLVGKVTVLTGHAVDLPCGSTVEKVPLTGANIVGAVYSTATTAKSSPRDLVWTLSAAVFTTAAQAKSASAALMKAMARCPKVQVATVGTTTETLTRTVDAPTSSNKGRWTGRRTVTHLNTSASPVGARIFGTYLTRSNVIVKVQEIAPLTPSSGARQDRYRKAVIVAALARLDSAG